jgi:hypothetical protein
MQVIAHAGTTCATVLDQHGAPVVIPMPRSFTRLDRVAGLGGADA